MKFLRYTNLATSSVPEQRVTFYVRKSKQENDTILLKNITYWSYKTKQKHFIHINGYTTNVRQKEKNQQHDGIEVKNVLLQLQLKQRLPTYQLIMKINVE